VLVGDNYAIDYGVTGLGQVMFGEITGVVLACAVRDTVTDGNDGRSDLTVVADG
jgi:hypothetical protein